MNIVDRAKKIILSPNTEWAVIKNESLTVGEMFKQYAVILAAIPAVAGLIGRSIIGTSVFGVHTHVPFSGGLSWAVTTYVLSLVGVYALGFIIDALAPSFGCKKDMAASMKVAIFSMTASWLAGIFSLIPVLSILGILGLYSFYLMYIGMRTVKDVPPDKMVPYFAVTLIIALAIYVIIGTVAAVFTVSSYVGP